MGGTGRGRSRHRRGEIYVDATIIGQNTPGLTVTLGPGEGLRAQSGAMLYKTGDVTMEAKMQGGLLGGLKRKVLAGESLFMQTFEAGSGGGVVGLAAPYPGSIARIDLQPGRDVIAERGAFLASTMGVETEIAFKFNMAGFFGGEGLVLQRLTGHGTAWVNGGGDFVEFELQPGQVLEVDTGCIVYMDASVQYNVQRAGGIKNMVFGGEGLVVAKLTGPGKVMLQTCPFGKMAQAVVAAGFRGGTAERGGVTSMLDSLGGILDN